MLRTLAMTTALLGAAVAAFARRVTDAPTDRKTRVAGVVVDASRAAVSRVRARADAFNPSYEQRSGA